MERGDEVEIADFLPVLGQTRENPWLRTGAKIGDYIYCTGTLGDSKMYLNKLLNQMKLPLSNELYFKKRHYRPTPRINWVKNLRNYNISSAMDISDGLVEDLQKLASASKVSFCIEADNLPLSENEIGIDNVNEHKIFYQKEALTGGEDYELLFTSPEIIRDNQIKITRIGRIISPNDVSFITYNGKRCLPNEFKGYEHR